MHFIWNYQKSMNANHRPALTMLHAWTRSHSTGACVGQATPVRHTLIVLFKQLRNRRRKWSTD